MSSNPPRPPTLDELLAQIRGGFDRPKRYTTELPERLRVTPPAPPGVPERGFFDEALARARGTFDVSEPDLFGTEYEPPPAPAPRVDTSKIQSDFEAQVAAGAQHVQAQGGDVEEFVYRTHANQYGERIAGLLRAGREHASKLLREGASEDEAERAGVDLAEKHIRNLEQRQAAGELEFVAKGREDAYQGLIEGFTTRKGLARHALTTGVPVAAGLVASGPLGLSGVVTAGIVGAAGTVGDAAAQKFVDDREKVDWESATAAGLTNILEVPALQGAAHGAAEVIANPLLRRAAQTVAVSVAEGVEEPTQAVAQALVQGQEIPSGYALGAEATAGAIMGGALGGAFGLLEQRRQEMADNAAGATEIESPPPTRDAGKASTAIADSQLEEIERALAAARRAGDFPAIQNLEGARQAILDARAKGTGQAVAVDSPPPPGEAGPPPAPGPTPPPGAPPPATGGAPPAAAPPGPVSDVSIRPKTPQESPEGAAGETSAIEDAQQRQAGTTPQVRGLTEAGKAAASGAPPPPTPPVVTGPTGGTARGVETTPAIPPAPPGRPPAPTAAPPATPTPPTPAPAAPGGKTVELGGMGTAIADNLYRGVFDRLLAGKRASPFDKNPPAEQAAEDAFKRGEIRTWEDVRAIMQSPPKPLVPARRLRIGRGKNGQVEVIFPDQNHADLFAWFGRVHRGDTQKANTAAVASRLKIPPDLFGAAAIRYRDAVMEALKGLPAGAQFVAPPFTEVVRPTGAPPAQPPEGQIPELPPEELEPEAAAPPPAAVAPAAPVRGLTDEVREFAKQEGLAAMPNRALAEARLGERFGAGPAEAERWLRTLREEAATAPAAPEDWRPAQPPGTIVLEGDRVGKIVKAEGGRALVRFDPDAERPAEYEEEVDRSLLHQPPGGRIGLEQRVLTRVGREQGSDALRSRMSKLALGLVPAEKREESIAELERRLRAAYSKRVPEQFHGEIDEVLASLREEAFKPVDPQRARELIASLRAARERLTRGQAETAARDATLPVGDVELDPLFKEAREKSKGDPRGIMVASGKIADAIEAALRKHEAAERRETRATELSPEELAVVSAAPGAVAWPTEDSLEIARAWYATGKKGLGGNLALYRALTAAIQLGVPIHEGWYEEFPDLRNVEETGRRKKTPAGQFIGQETAIPGVKRVYSSGMSRAGDLESALGWEHPFGVDINELTKPAMSSIAHAFARDWPVNLFVDSGAFTAFRKGQKQDAQAVVAKYRQLLDTIMEANVDETDISPGQIILTVPDVIGDQQATLESFRAVADEMSKLPPFFRPLFPLQTGDMTLDQFLDEVITADIPPGLLDRAIWGVPSNAAAAPVEEIRALGERLAELREGDIAGMDRVHFLGAGSEKTLRPLVEALGEGVEITGDSNRVRAKIGRVEGGREGAVRAVVGAEGEAPTGAPIGPATPTAVEPTFADVVEVRQRILNIPERHGKKAHRQFVVEALDKDGNVVFSTGESSQADADDRERDWLDMAGLLPGGVRTESTSQYRPPTKPTIEGLPDAYRKAMETTLERVPAEVREYVRAQVETQLWRNRLVGIARDDYDYFGQPHDPYTNQLIKNRAVKRRGAKQKLESANAIYEAGWDTIRGATTGVKDIAAILKRLRQVVEGKGVRDGSTQAERPPITSAAYHHLQGVTELFGRKLEQAVETVKEYAKAHPRGDEDVLDSIARLHGSISEMSSDMIRRVVDIPGLGKAKIAKALSAGPGNADFDRIVAYRREAEAEERAVDEFFSELVETDGDSLTPNDRQYASPLEHPELRRIADALEEDRAAGLADDEHPLLKTFMWGIVDPATGEQASDEAAIQAIRKGAGRLFARIRMAYQDASEAAENDVPFDIPEGGADEGILEARQPKVAFLSAPQDPFGGRYGPPPKRLTPEQLKVRQAWAAKIAKGEASGRPTVPSQRPAAAAGAVEGEAAAATERPERGGARADERAGATGSGGRGGRGSVGTAGGEGARAEPRAPEGAAPEPERKAPAPVAAQAPRRSTQPGVFFIVNPREAQTYKRPPKFELIPPELLPHLSDEQQLGVAKALEATEAGSGFLFQDGTGVGKTREILAVAYKFAKRGKKVLIVSPSGAISPKKTGGADEAATGSYADDSAAMGVPIRFTRERGKPLKPGTVTLGTYYRLRDYAVDKDTLLVFDESHALKNIGESEIASAGVDLINRAGVTLFASATPGDKGYHLAYLSTIGVLEGKPLEQAMRDLGMAAVEKERVSQKLKKFYMSTQGGKLSEKDATEKATEKVWYWRVRSPSRHRKELEKLFERLTEQGTVIKREVDLSPIEVQTVVVNLPLEARKIMDDIEAAAMSRQVQLLHMRRQQEPYKLAKVQELIQEEMAQGRQVVVFATRVNQSDVIERRKLPGGETVERLITTSEGTLKQLAEWLDNAGIPYSEIHGEAKEDSKTAQARFQSGNAKVVIATYEKGGTGINLDDRTGAAPRTMILMTAPFDSVNMVQAIGRVHRFTTRTPSRIRVLYSDHGVDTWNAGVIGGKLKQLHAQVSGDIAALNLANTSGDEETMLAGVVNYQTASEMLASFGQPGPEGTKIYNKRLYGKIVHTLKNLGLKYTMKGGELEIPTLEGFTIQLELQKTPGQAQYAVFKWEHDDEAADLRLAAAMAPPKPKSNAPAYSFAVSKLRELASGYSGIVKPIVSMRQHNFIQGQLNSMGATWGTRELPGSWQIVTKEGQVFTGELTPPKREVFGRAPRGEEGSFYHKAIDPDARVEASPVFGEAGLTRAQMDRAAGAEDSSDLASERSVPEGIVGLPSRSMTAPVFARPDLAWGKPARVGQGLRLERGRKLAGGGSVLASVIREGFVEVGRIEFEGLTVRSLADAAALFHTARNPSLEHAAMLFLDQKGRVVYSMQTSSQVPTFVSWGDTAKHHAEIRRVIDDFAARGVKIASFIDLHNHPSGDPEPSLGDMKHYRVLAREFGALFKGAVVIDHERASLVSNAPHGLGKQYIARESAGYVDPDPFLSDGVDAADLYDRASTLPSALEITELGRRLLERGLWKQGSTEVMALFLDGKGNVKLLTSVPQQVFESPRSWDDFIETHGRAAGAHAVYAATNGGFRGSPGLLEAAQEHILRGKLQEFVDLSTATTTPAAAALRQAGLSPRWDYAWDDGGLARDSRLHEASAAKEPPVSAYPEWGKAAPEWWARRVRYARARTIARGRSAVANVGINPQAFWDAVILGIEAVRNGLRKFGAWLTELARVIPGFAAWAPRVWQHIRTIGAPIETTERGKPKPFGQVTTGAEVQIYRGPIRPIPQVTPRDLARATEGLLSEAEVDFGLGKPRGVGRPGDLAVNIHNIQDEGGLRETMARIVRAIENRFDLARRKFTTSELRDLATLLGYDETDYLRMVRQKGALTAPEIIAGRFLRQAAGVDFQAKHIGAQAAAERAKEEGISDAEAARRKTDALEAERESQASLQKLIAMMYGTAAAGAEAGRALYAHKLLVSSLTPEEQFLQKLLRSGRADQQQLSALAEALKKGDQAAVARLLRRIHKPGFTKMLIEYFINSLLSAPSTPIANMTGNLIHEAVMRTPERAVAARLEQLGIRQGVERILTGKASPSERVVGEAMEALRAQVRHKFGIIAALDMARQALTKEDLNFLSSVKGESYVPSIPGPFGKFVRTPGRVMEALDLGAKIAAEAAEKAAQLWRLTYSEMAPKGFGPGSQDFRARLAELHGLMDQWLLLEHQRIADPITFEKEHGAEGYKFLYRHRELAEVHRQMKAAADVSTFRDQTTRFTNFVKQMRGAYPWLTFVVPFVHTTERILVQGFRRTPLGLLKSAYNIQQGKLSGGEASDRLAQGILGTLTAAAIYMLAADDLITGGGPEDPRERENWLKTGKLPYAIRLGDTWVSYARLEPFATIFGFAADLAEAKDEKTAGDAFGKLHYAVLNNVTNKTYLEGLVSAAEAIGDPDRYMNRYWKRSLGAFVPNILAAAARAVDPTIRETDDLSQTLMSRVPILSTTLPPRLTGTGEPTRRQENPLSRFVSPVRYQPEAGPEKNLERLFLETGYSPSQPPRDLTLPGTHGRKVELTRAEREIYAGYSRRASAFARDLAKNRDWTGLDVYAKEELLKRIYRFAHDSARRDALASVLRRLQRGEAQVAAR